MPDQFPVAIITGAGRGIGRETALRLAREHGWGVVVAGRTAREVNATAGECAYALPIIADVADPRDCQRLFEQAIAWQGRVDALVNNAGYAPMKSLGETSLEEYQRVIDVNLTAAFVLCRAVWPHFVQRQGGVIVNLSSMAAKDPLPGFAAYGAAKAGLNTLGLALAREGALSGVRVHTIAPGAVETAMFRSVVDEATWPKSSTLVPGDVADLVCACVTGTLPYTSGETIYMKRHP